VDGCAEVAGALTAIRTSEIMAVPVSRSMIAPTLLHVSLQDEASAGIPYAGISDGAVRHRRSCLKGSS
jgi:hypothetical protein